MTTYVITNQVRTLLFVLLASAQAFAQGSPQPPLTARATQHPSQALVSPPVIVPFEFLVNRPLIRATINGQGPYPFLLAPDTDASVIDPEFAAELALKLPEGATTVTVELGLSETQKLKVPLAFEDVARRTPDLPAALRPRGILSLAVWKDRLVTFDFTRWRLSIEMGALGEPDQKAIFEASPDGALWLPLAVGAETVQCLVDPWFPGGLVLPTTAFTGLMTVAEPRDVGTSRTREGVLKVREGRLAHDLLLGPFAVKTPTVLLADNATTAVAGTSWLSRYQLTYDLAHRRVRLDRADARGTKNIEQRTKNGTANQER
jgi:hypothetical protein